MIWECNPFNDTFPRTNLSSFFGYKVPFFEDASGVKRQAHLWRMLKSWSPKL